MTQDIAQQNLKEPEKLDWESAFSSSKYQVPPPALGPDGKPIVYYGTVADLKEVEADQGFLNFQIDLSIVRSGSADGRRVRAWISTRPFTKKDPETGEQKPLKGNPNKLATFLRSAGLQAKPQTNNEYRASVRAVNGKAIPFTIDWEARNKDTQETVRGYNAFPDDPERPGQKKAILKSGDVYNELDSKGNVIGQKVVQSEILFANPRLKYFQDSTKGQTQTTR
jgi:hypothetical protein